MLYFCGDIHGNLDGLNESLEKVKFNKKEDKLICCGDLVDRGTQNELVVYLLDEPWFDSIRGNHDQWCIDSFNDPNFDAYHHILYGGAWFYSLSSSEKLAIVERLVELPFIMEVNYKGTKFGLVHAEVPSYHWDWDLFVDDINDENMNAINRALWGRMCFDYPDHIPVLENVDVVIHGHSGVKEPRFLKNRLWIDTGYEGDGITVISAEDIIKMKG